MVKLLLYVTERVLYARNKYPPGSKPPVAGGIPITDELATVRE